MKFFIVKELSVPCIVKLKVLLLTPQVHDKVEKKPVQIL